VSKTPPGMPDDLHEKIKSLSEELHNRFGGDHFTEIEALLALLVMATHLEAHAKQRSPKQLMEGVIANYKRNMTLPIAASARGLPTMTEWQPSLEQVRAVTLAALEVLNPPRDGKSQMSAEVATKMSTLLTAVLAEMFVALLHREHTNKDHELDAAAPKVLDAWCEKSRGDIKRRVAGHFRTSWGGRVAS
jgi:hypothetical protein